MLCVLCILLYGFILAHFSLAWLTFAVHIHFKQLLCNSTVSWWGCFPICIFLKSSSLLLVAIESITSCLCRMMLAGLMVSAVHVVFRGSHLSAKASALSPYTCSPQQPQPQHPCVHTAWLHLGKWGHTNMLQAVWGLWKCVYLNLGMRLTYINASTWTIMYEYIVWVNSIPTHVCTHRLMCIWRAIEGTKKPAGSCVHSAIYTAQCQHASV